MRCTTVTSQPRTCKPRAASRPSSPPPITTAFTPGPARSSSWRVSSRVRKAKTPSLSSPAIGGLNAELPVASSSVSYWVTLPSSPVTVFASASTSDLVLLVPVERVQRDLVGRTLTSEHRRQQNAVVVDVRFVAENRDLESRRVLEDLLDTSHTRHAVADDDEPFHDIAHLAGSTRTAHCL